MGRVTVKNHHSNFSIEFECTDTSWILIPLCFMQRSLGAVSHATITRVWCNAYKHLHKHVQTSLWGNLVNILETQCPMTFIVLLGLARKDYLQHWILRRQPGLHHRCSILNRQPRWCWWWGFPGWDVADQVVRRSSRDDKSRAIFVVGLGLSLSTDPIGLDVSLVINNQQSYEG